MTARSAIKWLFNKTLDRRQEIVFWLTAPTSVALALLALSMNAPNPASLVSPQDIEVLHELVNARWERLTPGQSDKLVVSFSQIPHSTKVFVTCNSSDGMGLAQDLTAVFKRAGLAVPYPPQASMEGIGSGIAVNAKTNDLANQFKENLKTVGINAETSTPSMSDTDLDVTVIIGFKPPP